MRVDVDVKPFKGHVILPEFLNILQVRRFEDAYFGLLSEIEQDGDRRVFYSVLDEKMLPVLLGLVLEWHIEGVPEKPTIENFPQTPRGPAHDLLNRISSAVYEIWRGEVEVPNE